MLWGVSWVNIQMMLIDMPSYEYNEKADGKKDKMTARSADDVRNFLNQSMR